MIPRHLESLLLTAVKEFPVVTVTGPRQSGKTTLVRTALPKHTYVSLEDPEQRRFALDDPRGFLAQFPDKVILDEAQRAPDLFSYIQVIVDEERQRTGRFILTGSQNFLLLSKVSQSLAGRCAVLHLLPFSRAELAREKMVDIVDLIRTQNSKRHSGKNGGLFKTLFTGGYPRIHDQKLDPQTWLGNYYQTYLERDVREVLNVGDIETFGRFLGLCAGRVGQLLNLSSLANDCGITHSTARRWISVLEASFVVTLLRPYHENFNKRLVKSPKLYFLDSGLLCHLLRIRKPEDLALHASRGAIFESWVVSETIKNFTNRGLRPEVSFWRDSVGHEVDLVIDIGSGEAIPVEIKSGQTFSDDFVENLNWWRKVSGASGQIGVIVYGGERLFAYKSDRVVSWQGWG
jgi:hypothetical protein